MSMGNPLQSFLQDLFEQQTSDVKIVDDNCAMMPPSKVKSTQHERNNLSHSLSSQPSLLGLSRWDSHPMQVDRNGRCCKHDSTKCPTPPRRTTSFEDKGGAEDALDEWASRRRVLAPLCPARRASVKESLSDDSSATIDPFLANRNKTFTGSTSNTPIEVLDDHDSAGAKIQTDRFLRPTVKLLDVSRTCSKASCKGMDEEGVRHQRRDQTETVEPEPIFRGE